ncbi:hypothetical protein Glove_48g145 [Diversispora epigaea]|uniref:Uncharacterized protein n=1 Tax=Diversispora epigaea TaxID=1348612 RepID=A0A397JNX0_9GLOM|nr:hypothetical protein Glove_48g145 [Diversispora epigaea]
MLQYYNNSTTEKASLESVFNYFWNIPCVLDVRRGLVVGCSGGFNRKHFWLSYMSNKEENEICELMILSFSSKSRDIPYLSDKGAVF